MATTRASAAPTVRAARDGARAGVLRRFWAVIEGSSSSSSGSSYYMILGSTLALTAIGLMMVLSSSAVEAISEETSSYALFLKQGTWAAIGLVLMFVFSRLSIRFYKRMAWPGLGIALVLLLLVFSPLGIEVYGNRNWIGVGGFTAQPSEAAKLALSVWMAAVLARKGPLIRNWKHAAIPVLPVALGVVGLIMLGRDLGTSLIVMMIVAAALFFAGAPMRMFTAAGIFAVAAAAVLAATSSNRMDRISSWLGQNCDNGQDLCLQSQNGLYALASGGWFGVGLGQSRQKWNWIPEAHNDFIFAIIGEELGLLGTTVIVALFGIFAVALVRVVLRHNDVFVRILSGTVMVWLLGQAFVNIAVVTGLLPVIGVPLPFISYGGSALTFALAGVGVVLSFARVTQPESEHSSA